MKITNIKSIAFIRNLTKAYTEGIYADTPANRKLGRVGMSYKEWTQKQQVGGNQQQQQQKEDSKKEKQVSKEQISWNELPFETKGGRNGILKILEIPGVGRIALYPERMNPSREYTFEKEGEDYSNRKSISRKEILELYNNYKNKKINKNKISSVNYEGNFSNQEKEKINDIIFGVCKDEINSLDGKDSSISNKNLLEILNDDNIVINVSKENNIIDTEIGGLSLNQAAQERGFEFRDFHSLESKINKKISNLNLNRNNNINEDNNLNKEKNQKLDLTSKKFSEETNNLLREASSLLSNDFDYITKETGLGKDIFEKKGIKYYIESVSNRLDDQGAIFTDGKGNFWDLSYSDSQGVFLRKINEGVTKNPLRPALQDALRNTLKYSKAKLDNLIKEGKIDEWIKNEISVLKNEDKERPGYHHVYNSLPLAYVNKKKNNKEWNSVLSELKNLSDNSRENNKNLNPFEQGYVHIGEYRVYSDGNNYSIENKNGESLAKFDDLGKFNNEDLKLLKSILNLNKSK